MKHHYYNALSVRWKKIFLFSQVIPALFIIIMTSLNEKINNSIKFSSLTKYLLNVRYEVPYHGLAM